MIDPRDHFAAIQIRPMDALPEKKWHALVPRYALEPEPRSVGASSSDSQVSSIVQVFNDNLSNVTLLVGDLQHQIDCFEISCNEDGTISWTFECEDDE